MTTFPERPGWPRRQVLRAVLVTGAASGLAGCGGNILGGFGAEPAPPTGGPVAAPPPGGGARIGLVLPLSAPGQGATAALSLKHAAEMAVAQFNDPTVQLIVKDDKGTPEGARAAVQEAIGEGAQIILGPLFAASVAAAAPVARESGRPIIAFSSDSKVAAKGVYLLSFLVENEVARVVDYASAQRIRSYAVLAPDNAYGTVALGAFQQAVTARGGTIVVAERLPDDPHRLEPAVEKAVAAAGQAQALFIPADADYLAALAPVLARKGYDPGKMRPLGTGVWNDPRVFKLKEYQGGWFAAPDTAGFNAFAARYRARYNQSPTRIATLSYDAVSLAVALARQQGARAYADETLTNPSGYGGADGIFRFRAEGTNDRALAVLAVQGGATTVVSAAPQGFQGS